MTNYRFLVAAALFAAPLTAFADGEVQLKSIPLTSFMQDHLVEPIGLPIPVPIDYQPTTLPSARLDYSYWMRKSDADEATKTKNLPASNGFMYGKISLDVGYDKDSDLFVGLEEPSSIAKTGAYFSSLTMERCRFEQHPIVLLTAELRGSGPLVNPRTLVYAAYVATGIETNTIYIALRPPGNSHVIGEQFVSALKASLSECKLITGGP